MTSKERMIVAMMNKQPDRVPVSPDISNMIPCKLTGKPFWDIYLYQNPPLWKAYIDAVKYFGFDGWLPLYEGINAYEDLDGHIYIVHEDDEKIITRRMESNGATEMWSDKVMVYPNNNPPSYVDAYKLGIGERSEWYRPIEGVGRKKSIVEIFETARNEMGDNGVVGLSVNIPAVSSDKGVYRYYDDYERVKNEALFIEEQIENQISELVKLKPDFIFVPYSGGLTFQTPEIFKDLGLPSLIKVAYFARKAGIPSQMHCCGRSRKLVEFVANESDLSNINPLEEYPMGDCNLAEVKKMFGGKISFMGNLNTPELMLTGTPDMIRAASRKAIDDAACGGGFILSTGDQCGRDTPDENIRAMIEEARSYGKYY